MRAPGLKQTFEKSFIHYQAIQNAHDLIYEYCVETVSTRASQICLKARVT